ncbi:MAG: Tom20 family protein, partial [Planctomycetota bacterium]|nr:Tom20 family protein [Planctomycetota bacterium]
MMRKRFLPVLIGLLLFMGFEVLVADEWEDVLFLEALQKRGAQTRNDDWFKLAREYGMDVINTKGAKFKGEARIRLAQSMDAVLSALSMLARQAGDEKSAKAYEEDRLKVSKIVGGDKPVRLAKIERDLLEIQSAAALAEVEVDKKVKAEKIAEVKKRFDVINKEIEDIIKQWREDIANKYPCSTFWPYLSEKDKEGLPDDLWARDYLEFIYARSYIYQAKIYEGEERNKRLNTAIKKFLRFTRGQPEFAGDRDPEPKVEFVPKTKEEEEMKKKYDEFERERKQMGEEYEPEPRAFYPILEYFSYYWMARAYFDLGDIKNANQYSKFALQAVRSVEQHSSQDDITRVIEVILKANLLLGQALKKENKHEEAVEHFYKALALTGQPIDPARADEVKFVFPDVYKFDEGRFIAMELGESLVTLKRYVEGMSVVFKIYSEERMKRSPTGQPSEMEVVAANWMAKIYDTMGAAVGTLPVGQMFAVAEGYYSQKMDEKAMRAYQLAICAPGTPEEQNFFVPVAMFRLGVLLQDNKRFMESFVVFTELVRRFEKHEIYGSLIIDAVRGALASGRKLSDLDDFGKEMYKKAKELQEKVMPKGKEMFDEKIRLASQYIQQKKYDAAIETLQGLTETFEEQTASGQKRKVVYDKFAMGRALLGAA